MSDAQRALAFKAMGATEQDRRNIEKMYALLMKKIGI